MADVYETHEVEDQEAWDGLVRRSSEGTVFSTSPWLRCAQAGSGGRIRRIGCFKNGRLVGGCGFIEVSRAGLKKGITPVLTPYGGVLTVPPESERPAHIESERNRIVRELVRELVADCHYVQLFHSTRLSDVRQFLWTGWTSRVLYTYLIDLRDLDQLWNSYFEKRTNNAVRKAEKSGFSVHRADDVAVLVDLYRGLYARKARNPPVPYPIVGAFYQAAQDAGLAQMYEATDRSGTPVSACVVVPDSDTVYAWISGADPDSDRLGATSLLYWRILQDVSTSHNWFDFVGANMPSIARFKRGFGGVLHTYYATEKHRSPLSAAAMKAYGLIARLRRP